MGIFKFDDELFDTYFYGFVTAYMYLYNINFYAYASFYFSIQEPYSKIYSAELY